jgi:hypothetical protein
MLNGIVGFYFGSGIHVIGYYHPFYLVLFYDNKGVLGMIAD